LFNENLATIDSWMTATPESLLHCTGLLWCLPEEMMTGRLWPVWMWRATNDVSRRWFLSVNKAGWWLVQAALCRWWCCYVANQLWRLIEDAQDNNMTTTDLLCSHASEVWSLLLWSAWKLLSGRLRPSFGI